MLRVVGAKARHDGTMMSSQNRVTTERLVVRHPLEADRQRLVELFGDEKFMVFSGAVMSEVEAQARFDQMVARCAEVPFAK